MRAEQRTLCAASSSRCDIVRFECLLAAQFHTPRTHHTSPSTRTATQHCRTAHRTCAPHPPRELHSTHPPTYPLP